MTIPPDRLLEISRKMHDRTKRGARKYLKMMELILTRERWRMSKPEFFSLMGGSAGNNKQLFESLVNNGIVETNRKREHEYEFWFCELGAKAFNRVAIGERSYGNKRCPGCGCMATVMQEGQCVACDVRQATNRQRRGRMRV